MESIADPSQPFSSKGWLAMVGNRGHLQILFYVGEIIDILQTEGASPNDFPVLELAHRMRQDFHKVGQWQQAFAEAVQALPETERDLRTNHQLQLIYAIGLTWGMCLSRLLTVICPAERPQFEAVAQAQADKLLALTTVLPQRDEKRRLAVLCRACLAESVRSTADAWRETLYTGKLISLEVASKWRVHAVLVQISILDERIHDREDQDEDPVRMERHLGYSPGDSPGHAEQFLSARTLRKKLDETEYMCNHIGE